MLWQNAWLKNIQSLNNNHNSLTLCSCPFYWQTNKTRIMSSSFVLHFSFLASNQTKRLELWPSDSFPPCFDYVGQFNLSCLEFNLQLAGCFSPEQNAFLSPKLYPGQTRRSRSEELWEFFARVWLPLQHAGNQITIKSDSAAVFAQSRNLTEISQCVEVTAYTTHIQNSDWILFSILFFIF